MISTSFAELKPCALFMTIDSLINSLLMRRLRCSLDVSPTMIQLFLSWRIVLTLDPCLWSTLDTLLSMNCLTMSNRMWMLRDNFWHMKNNRFDEKMSLYHILRQACQCFGALVWKTFVYDSTMKGRSWKLSLCSVSISFSLPPITCIETKHCTLTFNFFSDTSFFCFLLWQLRLWHWCEYYLTNFDSL